MIRQVWRGLLDRLEGHRAGRAENLNGVPPEQFVRELRGVPEVTDLHGEPSALLADPGAMAASPAAGRRGGGRHRMPDPVTVTFPCTTGTIPRVVPECGTRPPWDIETGSFPAVAGQAEVPDGNSPDAPEPAIRDDPDDASSPGEGDDPPEGADELQEYLDGLPRYPDD